MNSNTRVGLSKSATPELGKTTIMALSILNYLQRENKGLKANWYRAKTSFTGIKRLATLPKEDKQACIDAYKFFQTMQEGEETETEDETKAVAAYYKVLNNMLSIFDLEKLYIPPQLDEGQGLYGNQLLCEQDMLKELSLENPEEAHLLDMGCGRGRVAHHRCRPTRKCRELG